MNDGNTPNGESGCLDLTQSLTSCANSEKSLNSSVLYFSHLQYQKFGLPICHSPFLSEIGFGPWLQPGPPWHLVHDRNTPPGSAGRLLNYPPDVQFSSTRLWLTLGRCLKPPFLVKSVPSVSEDAPPPKLELRFSETQTLPSSPAPHVPDPPPQTLKTPPHLILLTRQNLVQTESWTWPLTVRWSHDVSPQNVVWFWFWYFGNILYSLKVQGVWLKENACPVTTRVPLVGLLKAVSNQKLYNKQSPNSRLYKYIQILSESGCLGFLWARFSN